MWPAANSSGSRTLTVRARRSIAMTSVSVCTAALNRSRNVCGDATSNVRSSAMMLPT
jgi:hypothetical protein